MSKEELFQQYIEGRLDEQSAEKLLAMLENDPSALDALCEDINFDVRLRAYWKHYADERKNLDDQAIRAVEVEDACARDQKNKPSIRTLTDARFKTGPIERTLKIAAVIAIIAFFLFQSYREFVPLQEQELPAEVEMAALNLTGTITSVADPVFAPEHQVFKSGQLLETDRIILESGLIELELVNKARIVLEGPVDFQINSAMKLLCNSGRLSAFVPPEATRLEVATPRMVVRDIGTEFVVDVTPEESSVHVVRGKVDVNWFNADWMTFEVGEALKIDTNNQPLRFPAVFELFITPLEMKRKESASRQARRERKERLQQKWNGDQSLLYLFNPDDIVENHAGCKLLTGPTPGTKSVSLTRKSSSIPISIASNPRSLTLVSTFQCDSLRRGCNALFMARDDSAGPSDLRKNRKIYWQISGRGTIQLMIGKDGSDIPDEYESRPVFSKKNLRTWTGLATTIDADKKMITFYKDGQTVGQLPMKTLPIKDAPELDLSAMVIGNWPRRVTTRTDVRFEGKIAEFYVFNRVLSSDEIRHLTIP